MHPRTLRIYYLLSPRLDLGINPRVLKAEAQPRLLSEDLFPVKAEGEEFNVLIFS